MMALALIAAASLAAMLGVGLTVTAAVLAWQQDQPPRVMPAAEAPASRAWHLPPVTTPAPSAEWIEALRFEHDDTVLWSAVPLPAPVHPRSFFGSGRPLDPRPTFTPGSWPAPTYSTTTQTEALSG